jgi:hypothetical protein
MAFSAPLGCVAKVSSFNRVVWGKASYSELNGDREEVGADHLGDGVTSRNAREVDIAGLHKAGLALGGADDLLGEPSMKCQDFELFLEKLCKMSQLRLT